MNDFPFFVSITITNRCNLRCGMCGQWGRSGYLQDAAPPDELPVEAWKRVADEVARHPGAFIAIRGGEPFLYPRIIELSEYIKSKGVHLSFDSNGMLLERHAADIVRAGIDNINLSIDGPEPIHDAVRGVPGGFRQIAEGVAAVQALERGRGRDPVIKTIVFTISPDSYRGLAEMPRVARELGVPGLCIVPYYWFDAAVGAAYENAMKEDLGAVPFSWRGFHRETSGVDIDEFLDQLRRFHADLGGLQLHPYMPCTGDDYRQWFADARTPVGRHRCRNAWRLIDLQPDGSANFCVDFPDYVVGNIAGQSIEEIWNGERARRFREALERRPWPICRRCGAKYMSKNASDPEGL